MTNDRGLSRVLLGTIGFIAALLFWEGLAQALAVSSPETARFFPPPSALLAGLKVTLADPTFWSSLNITNTRVLAGFSAGVLVATPLGILLSRAEKLDAIISPVLDFGRYLPIPALVPISILWVGIGETQKILILFLGTFFQHFVLTLGAAKRVPQEYVDSALTLGASSSEILLRVTLPAALPAIYDAARVSMSQAWSYVLVAELVASERGIGYRIIRAERFLQTDQIIIAIIVLGLVGLSYDRLFVAGRKVLFPWTQL